MKNQRLLIGAGVLVVLAVGVAVVLKQKADTRYDDPAAGLPTLPALKADKITTIEITKPGQPTVMLTKNGTTWALTQPLAAPANQANVTSAIEKLTELKVTGVAATQRANHATLEVDDAHAVHVVVKGASGTLADLLVGASRGGNTMVRQAGQEQVLAVEGSIKFAFNRDVNEWRDKAITDLDATTVTGIAFHSANGDFRFVRDGEAWKLPEGAPAIENFDAGRVGSLLASLVRVSASDFAEPAMTPEQAGINAQSATVTFTTTTSQTPIVLKIGNAKGENDFFLMREGNDVIFVVYKTLADKMRPAVAEFQPPPAPPAGATPEPAAAPEAPPGGGGQIPPEVLEQLRRQIGAQAAPH